MQIRDNVRERRRERIQKLMDQEAHKSEKAIEVIKEMELWTAQVPPTSQTPVTLATPPTTTISPSTVPLATTISPPTTPSITLSREQRIGEEADPELWWKEREKFNKDRHNNWQGLKGIAATPPEMKSPPVGLNNANLFMRGFAWRVACAALLFAAAWGWLELELPGNKEARLWMVSSVTRDMDFEAIEAWYSDTFGGSPSFISFNQNNVDTEAVSARFTPEETIVPVQGKVIESFVIGGAGMKLAALSGSDVSAIFTGRVQQVTQDPDEGITILVQHPNRVLSVYGGLGKSAVKPNDWVETGQLLGQLEASGSREGILYFAVQQSGKTIDPAEVVAFD